MAKDKSADGDEARTSIIIDHPRGTVIISYNNDVHVSIISFIPQSSLSPHQLCSRVSVGLEPSQVSSATPRVSGQVPRPAPRRC